MPWEPEKELAAASQKRCLFPVTFLCLSVGSTVLPRRGKITKLDTL